MGGSVLGSFDGAKVTAIRIQQDQTRSTLSAMEMPGWSRGRGNYPANLADLGSFLQKLDGLKVARPVNVGASRLPMLELTGNAVTVVDLLGADGKPIKSLRLGKQSTKGRRRSDGRGGFPDGRYVQVGDAVSLVGDPLSSAKPSPEEWIAKSSSRWNSPLRSPSPSLRRRTAFPDSGPTRFGEWILVAPAAGETLDKNKLWSFRRCSGPPVSPTSFSIRTLPHWGSITPSPRRSRRRADSPRSEGG